MNELLAEAVTKRYGARTVLENFSLRIPRGGRICLMGPSGCGKTTLLRILLGLETPDGGTVTGCPPHVAAVFQEDRLLEDFSALTNVRLTAARHVTKEDALRCLAELGLAGETGRPVRELSGGMKRRVALARALLAEHELLVLDEAFKGLDEDTRRAAAAAVLARETGKSILSVTHDGAEAALLDAAVVQM